MTHFIARITLTIALAATLASHAGASAVQSYMYSTSGNIAGTTGVNLGYPIGFTSGPIAMLTTPGTFTLGTITTGLLPAGATLTYDNTPFTINLGVGPVANNSYNYNGYNGYYGFSPAYSYQINGVLNGSLTERHLDPLPDDHLDHRERLNPTVRRERPEVQPSGNRRSQRDDVRHDHADGPGECYRALAALAGPRAHLGGNLRRGPRRLRVEPDPGQATNQPQSLQLADPGLIRPRPRMGRPVARWSPWLRRLSQGSRSQAPSRWTPPADRRP